MAQAVANSLSAYSYYSLYQMKQYLKTLEVSISDSSIGINITWNKLTNEIKQVSYNPKNNTYAFEEVEDVSFTENINSAYEDGIAQTSSYSDKVTASIYFDGWYYDIEVNPQIQTLSNEYFPTSIGGIAQTINSISNGSITNNSNSSSNTIENTGDYGSLEFTSMQLDTSFPYAPKYSFSFNDGSGNQSLSSSNSSNSLLNSVNNWSVSNKYLSLLLKTYPQDFNLITMYQNSNSTDKSSN